MRSDNRRGFKSWYPPKHEGVAKIHLERVERKGTMGQCDANSKTVLLFTLTCQGRFVREPKSSSFPAKNGKHTAWAALRVVVVWAWAKHYHVLGEFPPILVQSYSEEQDRALLV